MPLSLSQASKKYGIPKTTLHTAITTGKLSARQLDNRRYSIDPVEVERWLPYNASPNSDKQTRSKGSSDQRSNVGTKSIPQSKLTLKDAELRIAKLEGQLKHAEEVVEASKVAVTTANEAVDEIRRAAEREREIARELVSSLSQRAERAENNEDQYRRLLISDQRPKGFWARLMGK